jgi:putative glycosyltransferase (TIGR04372 family)
LVGALLGLLPRRVVFVLLLLCDIVGLPGRRRLYQAYFPYATSHLVGQPTYRYSTGWSRRFKDHCIGVLFGIGAYREVTSLISPKDVPFISTSTRYALVRSLFELGEFERGREVAAGATDAELALVADLAYHKAMLDVIGGDETAALDAMFFACRGNFHLLRPHQNIAARNTANYLPNGLDVLSGALGRLFDLCNYTGQRVTHVGRGEIGVRLYERALDAQAQLRKEPVPPLSAELTRFLQTLDVSFDELRIIPEEWTTQIGHLGMLDILFRMRELGWWSGQPVLVVRRQLIANLAFFKLFEGFGKVVMVGETTSERCAEELLSLQRWCGMNFNAFRLPDGRVVPWQDAGALAIEQWEREGRGHPLRDAYDRVLDGSEAASGAFQRLRKLWGMKPDDWYVCLHTRDAAHYFEFAGTGQTHRNAPIETSLDAIRFITAQGGWVIKLGGPNSPRLPPLEHTVDYALSGFRTDLLDLHLIRHARAFIGTTSGLTNVAISFGIPSAIVNAITTDAQLWNKDVRFALKPVRLADGTMLTQRQLTSSPWRWRVFDAAVLGRSGARPVNNSAAEIMLAAKEVEALAGGRQPDFEVQYDAEALLSHWRNQLTLPYYYGTSRPSLGFLDRYKNEFLRETQDGA